MRPAIPLGPVCCALVATGCSLPDSDYFGVVPAVRDPHHLRYCNYGQPESLDPAQVSSTNATPIVHALFDGLTIYGDDGFPEASLATGWEIDDDQRRITFYLRRDARWSTGRAVTARDIVYQAARVLHPLTASPSADSLDYLKNYDLYLENRARVMMRAAGGLAAGTVVEVVSAAGKPLAEWDGRAPDPNRQASTGRLALRDLGAAEADAYATVPPGRTVTIIELSGRPAAEPSPDDRIWAYLHWDRGEGVYGWVPADQLDVTPAADTRFGVRPVAPEQTVGLDGAWPELHAASAVERPVVEVAGADLLTLPEILGVRAPAPYTLVVEASRPTPTLLASSASRVLRPTPREAVSRRPRRWAEPGTIVTSGPLHLVDERERDYLELVRSPTYWNQPDIKLDRLTIYSMDDQAASTNTYYTGGCDAVSGSNVPSSYLPILSGERRGGRPYQDYIVSPWLGTYFIIINTEKFDDVHLRRALALSLDRQLISQVLHGGEIGVASYVPGAPIAGLDDADLAACGVTRDTPGVAMVLAKGQRCYVPPPGLDYDPERARAELAQARAAMGDRFPDRIEYKFNVGIEYHKLIAEYVQAQWKQVLGIDVTLESQEWQVFLEDTRRRQYQTARMGWIAETLDVEEFLRVWRCNSPNNRPGWCNPRYEALLDQAAATTDLRARLALAHQAEQIFVEEVPVIPLFVYTQKHLHKPYVRDLHVNFIDQAPLWRAWLDPDWRSRRSQP